MNNAGTSRAGAMAGALAGVLVFALALAGCETLTPQPMSPIEETLEVSATVEKIDVAKRLVSLKGQSGDVFTVQVDPLVRNLPQVQVGDRVVVRYREAIGASIATTSGQPVTMDLDGDIAERKAGAVTAVSSRAASMGCRSGSATVIPPCRRNMPVPPGPSCPARSWHGTPS